jgi:hypothetical protein
MLEGDADYTVEVVARNKGGRPLGAESLAKRAKAKADADAFDAWCARWSCVVPAHLRRPDFERAPRTFTPGQREALRSGW